MHSTEGRGGRAREREGGRESKAVVKYEED